MDELLKDAARFQDLTSVFTLWEAILAMVLAFALTLIIGKLYQWTHTGVSYSKSFVQTLVIMAVVVSAIMLIIGSNIARAFSLVGALSIIRFRTAIKDSRDVAFVFFAMAVGMACGTRFYLLAVLLTLLGCAMVFAMHHLDFGGSVFQAKLLRVVVPSDLDYDKALEPVARTFLASHRLAELTSLDGGSRVALDYVIQLRPGASDTAFVRAAGEALRTRDIQLLAGEESITL